MTEQLRHDESTFAGDLGGQVYTQSWTPAQVRAVVVLAHGVHEHSGRYAHVAARLGDAGFAVHTLDHRGHGHSEGKRGNIGSIDGAVADLHTVRQAAERAHPDVPVFVLGHSMGGLVAVLYTLAHADGLQGLVTSGVAIDLSAAKPVEVLMAPVLSRLVPDLGVVPVEPEVVSRDPAVVADYAADPLNCVGKIRARTGAEIIKGVSTCVERMGEITLPVLALHGGADQLVPAAASELLADSVGSSDVTLTVHPGLYHEIFNEPERDQVLDEVVAWLDAHL